MSLKIDRYKIIRLLGQGGMGKVYLAEDPKLGRQVAIKVLLEGIQDPSRAERFRLEARALIALRHPNIIELYDYSGEKAPDLFLVMEYMAGASLEQIYKQRGNFSEPTALCVAHELCLALAHAHENNIVHRDLKPDNILMSRGRVVLTDFGIVKAVARSPALGVEMASTNTQILGTPGFMAPEQLFGEGLNAQSDLFSLGAVLYFLTTGQVPYAKARDDESIDGIYDNLKAGRFVDPRQHGALLSPGFVRLVGRCLVTDLKKRFATADEVRSEILELLGSHGVSEVRHELSMYEENPATLSLNQRQRSIDVLIADLKVALKDHDDDMALSILGWLTRLGPLDKKILDVEGVTLDAERRPMLSHEQRNRGRSAFVWGLVCGAILTGLGAVAMLRKTLTEESHESRPKIGARVESQSDDQR